MTFSNLDKLDLTAFVPFLLFFVCLFSLMKFFKGKPWIILIAILGCIYGYAVSGTYMQPQLLREAYPAMLEPSIWNFDYFDNDIALSAIIVGSFKVAFVAVLETLISARIADNLTGKFS